MLTPFCGYLAAGPVSDGFVDPGPARRVAARLNRAPAGRRYHSVLDEAAGRGLLRRFDEPSLLRYEVGDGSQVTVGVVGLLDAADRDSPLLPHEETVPAETSQRRSTRTRAAADVQPIVVMTAADLTVPEPSGEGIVLRLGRWEHRVSPIAAADTAAIRASMARRPLVIADGHHRGRVAAEHPSGPESAVLAWVVPAHGLRAGAFHRCFERIEAPSPERVAGAFRVESAVRERPRPVAGSLVWVPGDPGGEPLRLTPLPAALEGLAPAARGSMAAVARHALWPLLGVGEHDAVYVASAEDLVTGVGPGGGGFLVPGMPVRSIVAAAGAGVLLPPKATRFRPKPVRGAVIRPL